ncbi:MAG: septum site-determining protein MinC [bacterium]
MKKILTIKGTKGELIIRAHDEKPFDVVFKSLELKVQQAPQFFKGAVAHFEWGNRLLTEEEKTQLREMLNPHEILWQEEADSFEPFEAEKEQSIKKTSDDPARCHFLKRNVRAGQKIEYNGHIVIFGNIHAGGEVIATGNVFVWGAVRGIIHAGIEGNKETVVSALILNPAQLRIAGQIAINPHQENREKLILKPESASLNADGEIIVEPWTEKTPSHV